MNKNYIKFYVPSTRDGGIPLDDETTRLLVKKVEIQFAQKFGGFTAYPAFGGWYSQDKNTIIQENITIIESYYSCNDDEALRFSVNLAREIAKEWNQEAISIETREGIEFVSQ